MNASDNIGMYAKATATQIIENTKGNACLATSIIDSPVTPEITKRFSPIGRVTKPIQREVKFRIQK